MQGTTFLVDVDNTLLDNDAAQEDYLGEIRNSVSPEAAERYWQIFEDLRREVGYADYLGALQRYRIENLYDANLFCVSSYLLDYPFADRLYPGALEALAYLKRHGDVAILTDGDVVFQPRKILRSGLFDAVSGKVLVCVHKELELTEVERRFPNRRYFMVDDKIRILTAIKERWPNRVTTVFVRQGHYAADSKSVAQYPPADITVDAIGELIGLDVGPAR
jgi:FMN phosphatase YigB (HAD superfamily)